MELKNSKHADAVVNIYRSAVAMAQGSEKIALQFLEKSLPYLDPITEKQIIKLMRSPKKKYPYQINYVWAEKIFDVYTELKFILK